MASYHLSVKTIKRSAGRSSTAAAAYRAGERIECQREGRMHDYTAKRGIEETFILTPENAPSWAQDRASLWNAAEESETRRNSVTAREWELALPSEISAEDRSQITRQFAEELVSRYGVAVDVAIHAPHREGDQRNHHAHVLTTTRKLEPEGFTAKTRVLDSAKTGGVEIEQMREVWAGLQNRALERVGEVERVDHRSLEAQREDALSQGDTLKAEELDRDPEVKMGPAANAMERREMRAAEREGRDYEPVTERGRAVHAARQARALFVDMRERLELARDTYGAEREAGQGRVSAGLAALRAAASKDRDTDRGDGNIRDRLARIVGREEPEVGGQSVEEPPDRLQRFNERLRETLGRSEEVEVDRDDGGADKPSIQKRLEGVLNKQRETLEREGGRGAARDHGDEPEHEREIDREIDRDLGLSH
ncbi:MobQ family relaxase [Ruegeria sp. HKCCD7559]|uniref:MobQ family relaxase n=1 Tax=Ruegeria sp. HKCCD7559 TaxID=2683005 RepID=UPI00149183AB|nr:MobQ family relaxase [Ruegeria sp. HKCCD7559]NOC47710.1 MobA/MobL family protein [Ruegeria sp. HKCCD7559]